MAIDFFYPNICHVCKTFFSNKQALKKCSQCKLIVYCSIDHQKENWPEHQALCRAVRKVLKYAKIKTIFDVVCREKSWDSIRISAMCVTESMMPRPLSVFEKQMFWFPLACHVCHTLELPQVFDCTDCRCVIYCCPEHKAEDAEAHSKVCSEAKLCFGLDLYLSESFIYPEIRIPLIRDYRELPENILQFIDLYVEGPKEGRFYEYIASESLTCAATLLYAMEQATGQLLIGGCLSIHVVGASLLENSLIITIEVLLHWLADITSLNITFIGPETVHVRGFDLGLCESCSSRKRVKLSYTDKLYHQYADSSAYVKPDIILAYNCGFTENEQNTDCDTWKDTLPHFIKSVDILTVLTSYTKEEASADLKRVLDFKQSHINTYILTKCLHNPFRSRRPYRDWESGQLYYQNNFVTVIETLDEFDYQLLIDTV